MHQMCTLGCTVIVVFTMISNDSAFSTCNKTHTAGELLPKTDSVSSDNLSHSLVQASSFSQGRRDGGLFAHYRRRLPAGSLCSTITALWGCLTEAKEAESVKLSGGLVSAPTSLLSLSFSLLFGTGGILLCLFLSHADVASLQLFSLFILFIPTDPSLGVHYYKLMLHGQTKTNRIVF